MRKPWGGEQLPLRSRFFGVRADAWLIVHRFDVKASAQTQCVVQTHELFHPKVKAHAAFFFADNFTRLNLNDIRIKPPAGPVQPFD